MIRRPLTALAAAAAAALWCAAGSLLHAACLVAHVEGTSVWTVLTSHCDAAFTAWRASLSAGDRLLFAAVATLAAVAALAVRRPKRALTPAPKPTFGRFRTRITGVSRPPRA